MVERALGALRFSKNATLIISPFEAHHGRESNMVLRNLTKNHLFKIESRELNKQVHKNKYQMPNIEELMDTVVQTISEKKSGDIYFTTMDLTHAYGQLPLNAETSVQCNFSLIGGRSTGLYRFKTGLYGVTTMPAELQRAMDCILAEYPQAHAFIDDILVVTKGTAIDHIATVEKTLKKLNRENMSLKLTKCKFAQRECEWLGHKITHTGITPLVRKTEPINCRS